MKTRVLYKLIIDFYKILSIFILFAIVINLFSSCTNDGLNYNIILTGEYQLKQIDVNGEVLTLQPCENYTTLQITDNEVIKTRYYKSRVNGEGCLSFPSIKYPLIKDINTITFESERYLFELTDEYLILQYTAYDTNGDKLNVTETWYRDIQF